jgi:hypothetical protein
MSSHSPLPTNKEDLKRQIAIGMIMNNEIMEKIDAGGGLPVDFSALLSAIEEEQKKGRSAKLHMEDVQGRKLKNMWDKLDEGDMANIIGLDDMWDLYRVQDIESAVDNAKRKKESRDRIIYAAIGNKNFTRHSKAPHELLKKFVDKDLELSGA